MRKQPSSNVLCLVKAARETYLTAPRPAYQGTSWMSPEVRQSFQPAPVKPPPSVAQVFDNPVVRTGGYFVPGVGAALSAQDTYRSGRSMVNNIRAGEHKAAWTAGAGMLGNGVMTGLGIFGLGGYARAGVGAVRAGTKLAQAASNATRLSKGLKPVKALGAVGTQAIAGTGAVGVGAADTIYAKRTSPYAEQLRRAYEQAGFGKMQGYANLYNGGYLPTNAPTPAAYAPTGGNGNTPATNPNHYLRSIGWQGMGSDNTTLSEQIAVAYNALIEQGRIAEARNLVAGIGTDWDKAQRK